MHKLGIEVCYLDFMRLFVRKVEKTKISLNLLNRPCKCIKGKNGENCSKGERKIFIFSPVFGPLACLASALGPLACLAAALGPLACLAAAPQSG